MVESGQRLIEGLHTVLVLTGLHHRVDLMDLVFADQVSDSGIGNKYLEAHYSAAAFSARQQRLTENALKHERELGTYLRLLIGRKDVDDAVDGRGGGVGMQGGESQVTRFRYAQGRLDCLEVAHFAD